MSHTILLYGASGYTGRLIAAEGQRRGMGGTTVASVYRLVLAGRDGVALAALGGTHGMEHRAFSLTDETEVVRRLDGVDVIINAAGPFFQTARPLARAAMIKGCHYVDLNGELDVYLKLDQLGRPGMYRQRAMVSGAGHTAAASNLLLYAALDHLRGGTGAAPLDLGAIRIAMSRLMTLSRGSMATVCRSLRPEVTIVRMGEIADAHGQVRKGLVLWHEPVGRLERTFKFAESDTAGAGQGGHPGTQPKPAARIASAASLVDTLAARRTIQHEACAVQRIESYVEADTLARIGYQVGALLSPIAMMPWAHELARVQIGLLPEGPDPHELSTDTHSVVLEIEDPFRRTIIDWRWQTPNPYLFTAQVVLEIAARVAVAGLSGSRPPSDLLRPGRADLTSSAGYLRGCRLFERVSAAPETV